VKHRDQGFRRSSWLAFVPSAGNRRWRRVVMNIRILESLVVSIFPTSGRSAWRSPRHFGSACILYAMSFLRGSGLIKELQYR
jgi:hypothetical protein